MNKLVWLVGSLVAVSSLTTVACGDDDDDDTNNGGTSGSSAGSSGKGGGGKSGKGGNAGTAGSSGGTAGTAGTGSGGKSGKAGSGGGGAGGAEAGAGGVGESGAGGAGAGEAGAGEAGAGGASGSGNAGEAGASGAGGAGGAAPELSCEEIPSQAVGNGSFTITVTGFESCGAIPAAHTCDEKPFPEGTSPAMTWTEGPTGTQSYAIVFKDISILSRLESSDPLYNRGFHYVLWDIPASVTSLPAALAEGHLSTEVEGARQWSNFNDYGFFGPCPNFDPENPTDFNDSYAFTIYALPTATAEIAAPQDGISPVRQLDDQFKTDALAVAEYRGTSNAHASEIPDGVLPPTATPPCPTEGVPPDDCQEGPPPP